MVFALCKSSSPNNILGPRNTSKQRGGEKKGAAAISSCPRSSFTPWTCSQLAQPVPWRERLIINGVC